jgi:hypothetical protein
MAKKMLSKLLSDICGDYLEGLDEEHLKLGIWSGKRSAGWSLRRCFGQCSLAPPF